MVIAKPVMLVPRSEIICPIQTMVKPNMPVGRFSDELDVSIGMLRYYTFAKRQRNRSGSVCDCHDDYAKVSPSST
jgi:hypothetical protein